MESPRRYLRSLEQAFGPYTSRHIHVEAPRSSLRAWSVYLAIVAIALACAVLAGCTKAEASTDPVTVSQEVEVDAFEHGGARRGDNYRKQAAGLGPNGPSIIDDAKATMAENFLRPKP